MVKRAKKATHRHNNASSSAATKTTSTSAPEVDFSQESEHNAALLRVFNQHIAKQKIVDPNELSIKEVLLAISSELNTCIPGWSDLQESQMNTKNKLFRQVYQKLANHIKLQKPTVQSAPVQSSQLGASNHDATDDAPPDVSETSSEPDSADLYGSEDLEDELLDEEPDNQPDADVANQELEPRNHERPPQGGEAFDESVFWYHLEHYDNPINQAKRKIRKYRKLHMYWKLKLRKAREGVYLHICEEDSVFVNNKD